MHKQINPKEIEVNTSYKRTLMLIATSMLLAACGQSDSVDPFVKNAPEEEVPARKFVTMILTGDYVGMYGSYDSDGKKMTEGEYVARAKEAFGPYHEFVKNCGGLEAIEVFEKTELKPGEHYRLIYRVYMNDKAKADCKPWNFMPLHAFKTSKGWDVKG